MPCPHPYPERQQHSRQRGQTPGRPVPGRGHRKEKVMTAPDTTNGRGVRRLPPPPKDFDPFTATRENLRKHGLPLRPDPQTQPGMAALWERLAGRYRTFDHLEPRADNPTTAARAVTAG